MADKLFEYFLVYTTEWEEPVMEMQNADELMSQFWMEYTFALEKQNFTVETDFHELNGSLMVNIELLRRAFDNLYANLVKYADIEKPVSIAYQRESNQIHLSVANMVPDQQYRKNNKNSGLMDKIGRASCRERV